MRAMTGSLILSALLALAAGLATVVCTGSIVKAILAYAGAGVLAMLVFALIRLSCVARRERDRPIRLQSAGRPVGQ
jgi:hypothetical protein